MERKLIIALAGISLVLALALAGTLALFVGPSLVSTVFAQTGGGNPALFQMPCATRLGGQGVSFQMPCATRQGGSTGSGTGTTATGITLTGNVVKDAEAAGLAYYKQKYGDDKVTVKATDYGCHVQADVYKDGKVVKSLGYDRAGGVYELN